ncbi:MAG TPA: MmcQ/YjbR family DNA-binding protein [Thermoanaerobaculia bacterium]|nr:MmcQ/YjbR family DNA-binding protein [Thermoanaerobaculia bacterium]
MIRRRKASSTPRPTGRRGVTLADLHALAVSFPGVEEGPCYGTPGFRVRGRFLGRLWEAGDVFVLRTDFDTQEMLLAADPETFFLTDHYRGYPAILIRLRSVRANELSRLFEAAWRERATKKLVAELDRTRGEAGRAPAGVESSALPE